MQLQVAIGVENRRNKKYINKHLKKDFIKPSLSAETAFVLLIRKLKSGLKFYIDYRVFNIITIKNQYPIPLINKILGKLSAVA